MSALPGMEGDFIAPDPLAPLLMQAADTCIRIHEQREREDIDAALVEVGRLEALAVRMRGVLARELYPVLVEGS